MRYSAAIARRPGRDLAAGITSAALGPPSFELACRQHEAYVEALRDAGLGVEVLEALPGYPDAYFVEDVAVMLDDVAVVTRPGAEARRGEAGAIEATIAARRPLVRIEPPGTLDGGDVLLVGRRAFIGISGRTNRAGAERLGALLARRGYRWSVVPLAAGLHLKSSVNAVHDDRLLVAEGFPTAPFAGFHLLEVPASESYAANCLRVNERLLVPQGFPRTREMLESVGAEIRELDVSEPRKMDGGLSCMSLRF
jgi:dimethylargininase